MELIFNFPTTAPFKSEILTDDGAGANAKPLSGPLTFSKPKTPPEFLAVFDEKLPPGFPLFSGETSLASSLALSNDKLSPELPTFSGAESVPGSTAFSGKRWLGPLSLSNAKFSSGSFPLSKFLFTGT
eukprot:TRINITY_DN8937_c0_g2_i2.p1 TRINITY_DN8937_c0_g2~~TRINITY_DN8937_c0_g2_i2.p1  ORF type:complete len:128 (-),score=24.97 TRINITY_DN8937_c0_g2_i2:849-1232(-)